MNHKEIFGKSGVSFVAMSVFLLSISLIALLGLYIPEDTANNPVEAIYFIVEDAEGGGGIAVIRNGTVMNTFFDTHDVREVVSAGGELFVIAQTGDARDVFVVQGGTLAPLTADSAYKEGLAVSPGGTHLAYSTLMETDPELLAANYDVARYATTVIGIDNDFYRVYPGNHPHFIDNDTLFLMTQYGLMTHALSNGGLSTLQDILASMTDAPPVYSGEYFVVPARTVPGAYVISHVTSSLNPLLYERIAAFAVPEENLVLMHNDVLYTVSSRADQTVIEQLTQTGKDGAFVSKVLLALPKAELMPRTATF